LSHLEGFTLIDSIYTDDSVGQRWSCDKTGIDLEIYYKRFESSADSKANYETIWRILSVMTSDGTYTGKRLAQYERHETGDPSSPWLLLCDGTLVVRVLIRDPDNRMEKASAELLVELDDL